jgi:cell division protein ZapA
MSDGEQKLTVRVTIFGEEYPIRSDMGEEYTRACARHVDDIVQQAHVQGQVVEPHKAAVLAALQITDELFRERDERQRLSDSVLGRLQELRTRVDEATDDADRSLPTEG